MGSSTQKETISSLFLYFLHTSRFKSHRLLPYTMFYVIEFSAYYQIQRESGGEVALPSVDQEL